MREKLIPLNLPPGLYRNGTKYQAKGRWYDANLVRFLSGTVRPIGGWRRMKDSVGVDIAALTGVPRAMIAWRANTGVVRFGIGTNSKAYALIDGTVTDITPTTGFTPGSADSTFSGGTGAYGAGTYGSGVYGGGSLTATLVDADTWQFDTFGDYLVGCLTSDGKILVWDGNTLNKFVAPANAPTGCRGVVVTPERFLVALGAGGDPRRVYWASQESTSDWSLIDPANTAGDFPLTTNGRLMAGRRTRRQTLLWTDADMHTMTYVGGAAIYSFDQAGDNCGLLAPNAVAIAGTVAFWMSKTNFFMFDGYVKPIPCDVRDYVFSDINLTQRSKIVALTVSEFDEVWWFYPGATATEPDRYVVYNYAEGHWALGKLGRSAGVDRGASSVPIMVSPSGLLYEHEVGDDRGSEVPYIESGPIELGDGDQFIRVQRLVPDEKTLGDVTARLYMSNYPTDTERMSGPFSLDTPTNMRETSRVVRLRLQQARATSWRVGVIRLGGIPVGRR